MVRMPILVAGLLWGGGLLAQEAAAKPERDGIRVEARCVRNAPKGVEGIGEVRSCIVPLAEDQTAVIRFGKTEALVEDWEPIPPGETEPPAKPDEEPPRFRSVMGEPVLLGIELTLSASFEGALSVVGKAVYREVAGYSELTLDAAGATGKVPQVIESETGFQLMPPKVAATKCSIAIPGRKPIVLEICTPEVAK